MTQPSDVLRLVLEVERDADPIRGTVADPEGPARVYVGWLALMGALDELRGAPGTEAQHGGTGPS
jgi:hypothetical protein